MLIICFPRSPNTLTDQNEHREHRREREKRHLDRKKQSFNLTISVGVYCFVGQCEHKTFGWMTHRKMEQNEKKTKHSRTFMSDRMDWQLAVFSDLFDFIFNCAVIRFIFAQLSFNNQLMQSVRDRLIVFELRARKSAKEKETETRREWWTERARTRCIRKSINLVENWHTPRAREFMRARCTDLAIIENWVTLDENGAKNTHWERE